MTAGTYVLDIDVQDVISRLTIVIIGTNSANDPIGHPSLIAKQIDLVDGSDVLHSLRGCYSQAVGFYGTGVQPHNFLNYRILGKAKAVIPIYFGRELFDPEFAFDPTRFNNPQLKIQHDYSLGGSTPDACTIEVWGDIFDDRPANVRGFMMAKSHWTKTLVISTTDYVELPTDYPIRLVMPAAFSNDEEPNVNIASVKLTEDHDKRVVLESNTKHLLKMVEADYPVYTEQGEVLLVADTDQEIFITPAKDIQINPLMSADSDGIIHAPWSGGNGRILDASVGGTISFSVTGRSAHGVIPITMGRRGYSDEWWNTPELGSARIKMVTGAGDTSALYELLLQQARSY
jgi:hypothetical protein